VLETVNFTGKSRNKLVGKIIAVLVAVLAAWGALAQIMPDVFQVRRESGLVKVLWGPKTIWIAVLGIGCLLGAYIWSLEARLSKLTTTSVSVSTVADETGLKFVAWGSTPDAARCFATIDATKLPAQFRTSFEIALVCGFVDPAVDQLKDTRITVSQLFTPQDALLISVPFSTIMAESLAKDQEATVEKLQPRPPRGTPIGLMNEIWMKVVLIPKGADTSNIHRLADVPVAGGKIADTGAVVGITRTVLAK
jgi:hypothetical protein